MKFYRFFRFFSARLSAIDRGKPLDCAGLFVVLGWAWASTALAAASEPVMQFQNLALPKGAAADSVLTADHVLIGGKPHPLRFQPLLKTGEKIGSEVFGLIKNSKNQPLMDETGGQAICRSLSAFGAGPDFTSLLRFDRSLFAVTQFECAPGAFYVTGLRQDQHSGILTPQSLQSVNASSVGGVANLCAGVVTPWGTHLGGEEYEINAALLNEVTGEMVIPSSTYNKIGSYFDDPRQANPYNYGWITELRLTRAQGKAQVEKHYALGRFSHELAYVMPDEQTVYMSDDGTNGGFYMFVADKKADFSAGHLYAARWYQRSDEEAMLQWIDLGHARAAEIKQALAKKPRFADLLDKTAPSAEGPCPAGFGSVNTSAGRECLKVHSANETLVSRLESRRYAALRGATTEFRKGEGLAYNPRRNALYFALSDIGSGMLDGATQDEGGANDIRLRNNACGAVFEIKLSEMVKDNRDITIGSRFVAVSMKPLVSGVPVSGETATCAVDGIANPDNLVYIPQADALLIAEDSNLHANNMLWAYVFSSGTLQRILTAPPLAEVTSLGWYPDINGWSYVTVVIQHPHMEKGMRFQDVPAAQRMNAESVVGYLGPFPGFGTRGEDGAVAAGRDLEQP